MSNGDGAPSNIIGIRDVFEALANFRGEVIAGQQHLRTEIIKGNEILTAQALDQAKDISYLKGKMDGWVGALRWLGPAGLAALIVGIAAMSGLVHLP